MTEEFVFPPAEQNNTEFVFPLAEQNHTENRNGKKLRPLLHRSLEIIGILLFTIGLGHIFIHPF